MFSITVGDGLASKTLDNDYISYRLYETDDLDDWSNFRLVESGTDLDSLKAEDFDDPYYASPFWVIRLNATNIADNEWDDAHEVPDANGGTRCYGNRWFILDEDGPNEFDLYRTPTAGGASVARAETGMPATMNLSKVDIPEGTNMGPAEVADGNLTITVLVNQTEIDYCAYSEYFDYSTQEYAEAYLIFNFNSTIVENNDLSVSGSSSWTRLKSKYNTTAIGFTSSYLGGDPDTFNIDWDDDVTITLKCVEVDLVWDPYGANTVLSTLATWST